MLLRFFGSIPLLQCLTYFPVAAHKTASKKFIVILFLTSLPVIFAAVLSPIPEGNADVIEKLLAKMREAISVSELFVYTATFLTPVLYLIFEKYTGIPTEELGERIAQGMKGIFKGYGLVAFLSLLIMLFTAIAYSSLKVNAEAFKPSFLNHYLVTYSFWVYLFSLYCWYLTLLNDAWSGDFVSTNRNSENATADAFAARINKNRSVN
jgi:hypothetical protein